jgi:deoxycytidylate deaminase
LCANKIISVGIKEIIYVEAYPDADSVDFLERHPKKVKLTKFEGVKAGSFNKLFKKG